MIHMVRLWYDSEMLGLLVGQRWLTCEEFEIIDDSLLINIFMDKYIHIY